MKYFWLTNSIDNKIIGNYPQSVENKDYGNIRSINYSKTFYNRLLPHEPILNKKTKLTTLISTNIGNLKFLILNSNFIHFLNKFNISEYQTWNINIQQNKEIINKYQLFHLSKPCQNEVINYKNSFFFIGNIKDYDWLGNQLEIIDNKCFLEKKEMLRKQKLMIKCKKIILNFKKISDDLIRITDTPAMVGTSGYFVSEKLKNAIEENGFTGMDFKEIEKIDNRIEVIY